MLVGRGPVGPDARQRARGLRVRGGAVLGRRGAAGPGKTDMRVELEYTQINGLQLPSKLILDGSQDAELVHMELLFSDYRIETRPTT